MRGTNKRSAFELFKKGINARVLPITPESWQESDDWFREAIKEDTDSVFAAALADRIGYPRAWAWMAYGLTLTWLEGWQPANAIATAVVYADLAVELDGNDYDNHWVASFVYLANSNPEKADFHRKEALYLVEEDHNMHLLNEMADILVWLGRPGDAFNLLKKTRRTTDWNRWSMAWSLYFLARDVPSLYESALFEAENTFWKHNDDAYEEDIQLLIAAIAIQQADFLVGNNQPIEAEAMREKAFAARDMFLEHRPGWTIVDELRRMPFGTAPEALTAPEAVAAKNHWVAGLVKLELPMGD